MECVRSGTKLLVTGIDMEAAPSIVYACGGASSGAAARDPAGAREHFGVGDSVPMRQMQKSAAWVRHRRA